MGARFLTAAAMLAGLSGVAYAQEGPPIRLGVFNDQSGVYADFGGQGSVIAARMAVEDHGQTVLGRRVEIVSADHQNKPDIASSIARRWFDTDGVIAILDLTTSAVTFAVQNIAQDQNRAVLVASASSADVTGKNCNAVTVHWGFDSYANSNVAARAMVGTGAKSWFFLTGDNAGSHAQEAQAMRFLREAGGSVAGAVRHPLATSDFSSYLLQAQGSKAQAIALANAGGDTINAIKQAREFGIVAGGQSIVPMLVFISDIHALGLDTAQGLRFATGFYWDRTDGTRAWSKRFMERNRGRAPTVVQAGVYTLATHYLKAMAAAGSGEGKAVVAKMKETPVNDALWQNVRIREDGRSLNDMYLIDVKKPSASAYPWDYYSIISTTPGETAFRPMDEGGCPLMAKRN